MLFLSLWEALQHRTGNWEWKEMEQFFMQIEQQYKELYFLGIIFYWSFLTSIRKKHSQSKNIQRIKEILYDNVNISETAVAQLEHKASLPVVFQSHQTSNYISR